MNRQDSPSTCTDPTDPCTVALALGRALRARSTSPADSDRARATLRAMSADARALVRLEVERLTRLLGAAVDRAEAAILLRATSSDPGSPSDPHDAWALLGTRDDIESALVALSAAHAPTDPGLHPPPHHDTHQAPVDAWCVEHARMEIEDIDAWAVENTGDLLASIRRAPETDTALRLPALDAPRRTGTREWWVVLARQAIVGTRRSDWTLP